jgi:hypothetical protein
MGILDEAIREHLELKRQHGAGDSELKQLEDEAFGPPERPGSDGASDDPFAEAPTQFIAVPEPEGQATETAEEPELEGELRSRRESLGIADLQEPPPSIERVDDEPPAAEPAEEEQSAMEHEIVPEAPQPPTGPTTEERHAIAEQPTELFDVEGDIAAAPSDEELAEEEMAEPRLAPVDPLAGLEEAEAEGRVEVSAPEEEDAEEDDFFDEQRLSDELDQALEAPVEEEYEEPEAEAPVGVEIEKDDEADEEEAVEDLAFEDEDEGEPNEGEPNAESAQPGDVPDGDRDDDVLEETPDFLEDSEDDQLWFEQKPPKDFDFDD